MPESQIIKVNDRIRHPAYGVGVVLKLWRNGHELMAKVRWVEDHMSTFSIVIYPGVVLLKRNE